MNRKTHLSDSELLQELNNTLHEISGRNYDESDVMSLFQLLWRPPQGKKQTKEQDIIWDFISDVLCYATHDSSIRILVMAELREMYYGDPQKSMMESNLDKNTIQEIEKYAK